MNEQGGICEGRGSHANFKVSNTEIDLCFSLSRRVDIFKGGAEGRVLVCHGQERGLQCLPSTEIQLPLTQGHHQ